jgi:HD superfamily phosphohydrolase YqeK
MGLKMILEKEINLIKDNSIKEWTKVTLNNAPEYFFRAMASSTGKYHPKCTCQEGGLIIHVQRTVYIANRLCDGYGIKGIDRDIVISATILHDIAKVPSPKENPNITYADYENHPINAENYFAGEKVIETGTGKIVSYIFTYANQGELKSCDSVIINIIKDCIRYHMGLWTPQSIKKPIEQYTLLELIVYTADYIATTKDLITPEDNKRNEEKL